MSKKSEAAHKALVKESKNKKDATRERLAQHLKIQQNKLTPKNTK